MSEHLLVISIGPVQKFISAARRTRDLWFGSNVLSEISKAAARSIADNGGQMIFPAPGAASDLNVDSALNVANVILAELKTSDPKHLADMAQAAAQSCWLAYAADARRKAGNAVHDDIWKDQVNDVLEFNAAWVKSSGQYKGDRARLMRLLAGRKQCFDFPPAKGRPGVPKSSLDGLRESVLKKDAPEIGVAAGIHLAAGEQLDVVGVVKRAAGGNQSYPSVARIAADPWLRGLNDGDRRKLVSGCEELARRGRIRVDTNRYPQFTNFPFDGTVCFPSRFADMEDEGLAKDSLEALRKLIASLRSSQSGQSRESEPYLAVLVADGDRVGAAISAMASPDEHRNFSRQLAVFSSEAAKKIREFHGVPIYCGGDDVLALLPVDKVLKCAAALAKAFKETMRQCKTDGKNLPTLSVGVAIGHFMEPLEDLLGYGRAAEHHAKTPARADGPQPERNALAVHLHKRGGGPVHFRGNWEESPQDVLLGLAGSLNDRTLSHRIAADLENLARTYDHWPVETCKAAIVKDALATLAAKKPRSGPGGEGLANLKSLIEKEIENSVDLRRIACGILIARQLASALRQSDKKPEKGGTA